MSFRILFTSKIKLLNTIDLHHHQRLNFRKLVCYLSEDFLQQREPNLTSYKRLTKKKKKKKKKKTRRGYQGTKLNELTLPTDQNWRINGRKSQFESDSHFNAKLTNHFYIPNLQRSSYKKLFSRLWWLLLRPVSSFDNKLFQDYSHLDDCSWWLTTEWSNKKFFVCLTV